MNLMDFKGEPLWNNELNILGKENSSQVYFSIKKSELIKQHSLNDVVFSVKFIDTENKLYKNLYYFVSPKEMKLPQPDFTYQISGAGDSITIFLEAKNLIKNVHVDIYTPLNKNVSSPLGNFSDNYFDMLPGDKVIVSCGEKLDISSEIKVTTLYDSYVK